MGRNLFVQFSLWTELSVPEMLERHFGPLPEWANHNPHSCTAHHAVPGFEALANDVHARAAEFGEYLGYDGKARCSHKGFISSDARWHNLDHSVAGHLVADFVASVMADPDISEAAVGTNEWQLLAVKVPEFVAVPRWDLDDLWQVSQYDIPGFYTQRDELAHTERFYGSAVREALAAHKLPFIQIDLLRRSDGSPDKETFFRSIEARRQVH